MDKVKSKKSEVKSKKVEKTEKPAKISQAKPSRVNLPKIDSKKSSQAKPRTMEELLASSSSQIVVPQKNQVIKGTITHKGKKSMLIDIGAKTEGVVSDKEFAMATEYIDKLKVGDEIEAVVISSENDRGQTILSLKQAAMEAKWDFFKDALENETILTAEGIDVNKGGLIVTVNGMRGFVPSSQFGKTFMGKIKTLKGEIVKVRAIEVDREKNRLIFSERHVSEASEMAARDRALNNVHEGEVYQGVVSGVMPFGLFVTVQVQVKDSKDIGHVEGLVHISEISWEKVNDPRDYHSVGDEIKIKVLGVDPESGKLNLSLKQLQADPWQGIEEKYSVGTTFTGTVSRVEPFGVFVNVDAGVDGLIHMSKLTGQTFNKGDEVTVSVESVEPHLRRMSLSIVDNTAMQVYK